MLKGKFFWLPSWYGAVLFDIKMSVCVERGKERKVEHTSQSPDEIDSMDFRSSWKVVFFFFFFFCVFFFVSK